MNELEKFINEIVDLALKVEYHSQTDREECFGDYDTRRIFQTYALWYIKKVVGDFESEAKK